MDRRGHQAEHTVRSVAGPQGCKRAAGTRAASTWLSSPPQQLPLCPGPLRGLPRAPPHPVPQRAPPPRRAARRRRRRCCGRPLGCAAPCSAQVQVKKVQNVFGGGGGGGGETGGRCACRRSPPRMLTAASCLRACSMGPPGWRHAAPGRLAQALHHHLHIPPKFLEIDCPAGILVVLPLPLSHVGRPRRQAQPPKRRLRGAGVEWRRPAPDVGGRTGGVSAWTERQLDGFQGSSGAAPRAKATVRAAQSAPPLPPAPEGRSRRHLTDRRAG